MEAVSLARSPALGELGCALVAQAARCRETGDWCGARSALSTAVVVEPSAETHYSFAQLLADSGELTAAVRQLEQAWEHARHSGSAVWRARCCHALAELHRAGGAIDRANRYRQWAIRAELDGGMDIDAGAWLQDRADDALLDGDVETADQLGRAATRTVTDEAAARVLSADGVRAVRQGRWSQGLRCFVRAFHAARGAGDWRGCAAAVLNVGHTLQSRGSWQRAAACFEHAARLLDRLQDRAAANLARGFASECRRFVAAVTGDPLRN